MPIVRSPSGILYRTPAGRVASACGGPVDDCGTNLICPFPQLSSATKWLVTISGVTPRPVNQCGPPIVAFDPIGDPGQSGRFNANTINPNAEACITRTQCGNSPLPETTIQSSNSVSVQSFLLSGCAGSSRLYSGSGYNLSLVLQGNPARARIIGITSVVASGGVFGTLVWVDTGLFALNSTGTNRWQGTGNAQTLTNSLAATGGIVTVRTCCPQTFGIGPEDFA